jgi:hypothetical protein
MEALIQHTEIGEYMLEEERAETFKAWPFNEDNTCTARKVQDKCILFYGLNFETIACASRS